MRLFLTSLVLLSCGLLLPARAVDETAPRKVAPGFIGKEIRDQFEQLSPEEKNQLNDFRRKAPSMNAQERNEALSKLPVFKDLPPDQRMALDAKFQSAREKWDKLSPEQKREIAETHRKGTAPASIQAQPLQQPLAKIESKPAKSNGMGRIDAMAIREKVEKLSPEELEKFKDFNRKSMSMTLEERVQALEVTPVFQDLTPEKRAKVAAYMESRKVADQHTRELHERWAQLSVSEKDQIKKFREEAVSLTPEQRREAAEKLPIVKNLNSDQLQTMEERLKRLQEMPPEKRQKIMENFKRWQKMTPQEREDFRQRFRSQQEAEGGGAATLEEALEKS